MYDKKINIHYLDGNLNTIETDQGLKKIEVFIYWMDQATERNVQLDTLKSKTTPNPAAAEPSVLNTGWQDIFQVVDIGAGPPGSDVNLVWSGSPNFDGVKTSNNTTNPATAGNTIYSINQCIAPGCTPGGTKATRNLKLTTAIGSLPHEGITIKGVEVKIEQQATPEKVSDSIIQLIDGYGNLSANKARPSNIKWYTNLDAQNGIVDKEITYGGPTDLWNAPFNWNDFTTFGGTGFGIILSVNLQDANTRVDLDNVKFRVFYSQP